MKESTAELKDPHMEYHFRPVEVRAGESDLHPLEADEEYRQEPTRWPAYGVGV